MIIGLLVGGSRTGVKSGVEAESAEMLQVVADEILAPSAELDVPARLFKERLLVLQPVL